MIKKFLIIIVGIFLGIILFMPKDNIFFTIQKYLTSYNLYVNFSKINDKIFFLELDGIDIIYNNIDAVKINQIKIFPFIFFNKINIKGLNIENNKFDVLAQYDIFHPFEITIKGISNIANIQGSFNLKSMKLKVYLLNLKNKDLKQILKKDNKGYFYEQNF